MCSYLEHLCARCSRAGVAEKLAPWKDVFRTAPSHVLGSARAHGGMSEAVQTAVQGWPVQHISMAVMAHLLHFAQATSIGHISKCGQIAATRQYAVHRFANGLHLTFAQHVQQAQCAAGLAKTSTCRSCIPSWDSVSRQRKSGCIRQCSARPACPSPEHPPAGTPAWSSGNHKHTPRRQPSRALYLMYKTVSCVCEHYSPPPALGHGSWRHDFAVCGG